MDFNSFLFGQNFVKKECSGIFIQLKNGNSKWKKNWKKFRIKIFGKILKYIYRTNIINLALLSSPNIMNSKGLEEEFIVDKCVHYIGRYMESDLSRDFKREFIILEESIMAPLSQTLRCLITRDCILWFSRKIRKNFSVFFGFFG